ncbi:adenylate/guanylate cyclase domain-containing protein [Winogradskyella undariae]|uniref:adenylate/guanylate cyclase domain-containing protein n=1 Tax=Winogradskyella undariae TaxID=1285465 RepID=UPI0015CB5C33|nr:adenylate/guanylate cyclase domain-containing protein [Winogradskyella undariae]
MANIRLIKEFNKKYNKRSPIADLDLETRMMNESLEFSVKNRISGLGKDYTRYFIDRKPANLAFLFIDICSFSTRFSHLDGKGVAHVLDAYYDIVIPIIYKYGGEIDKIIGDGIICIFGPPFSEGDSDFNIRQADLCAKEIIEQTTNTIYYSKVAMHFGEIIYYSNGSIFYEDYTVVGKPITELFRLESISIDKKINFYHVQPQIDANNNKLLASSAKTTGNAKWLLDGPFSTGSLKGVTYSSFKTIELK